MDFPVYVQVMGFHHPHPRHPDQGVFVEVVEVSVLVQFVDEDRSVV